MDSSTCIEQKGVIEEIDRDLARVQIKAFSACANCHSKAGCGMGESADREILAHVPGTGDFRAGDTVTVIMKRTMGWKAAVLAYIVPFAIVLLALLILTSLQYSELVTGLVSLVLLVPYFVLLYLLRERLKTAFTFSIRKAY